MKTATVTWITHQNYGTYLQAYALQQAVQKLGHTNQIIDDRTILQPSALRRRLSMMKRVLLNSVLPSTPYYKKFRAENLKIDSSFHRPEELNDRYDAFLCGSDQIWSPYLRFRPFFYLDFVSSEKKKIAYAPSTGTGKCDAVYKKNVKPLIERFDAVSVREQSGVEMLSTFVDKSVVQVLDPTLLLTPGEWRKLVRDVDEQNYVLCYFLTPNGWYMQYAKEYARRHGKRLLIFGTRKEYDTYGDRALVAGPQEFLSYISHADKVFTDSYHASIFSILFGRDFVTFKRFSDTSSNNQNARVLDLFKMVDLQDYFIDESQLDRIESLTLPDYNHVYGKLHVERERSLTYLKESLTR